MDTILSHTNDDGSITWPKTDVMGGGYTQPVTRCTVAPGVFVVLPVGFTQWERIGEIKAALASSASKGKKAADVKVEGTV